MSSEGVRNSGLSDDERAERDRLYKIVADAASSIDKAKVSAGAALVEIRDRQLWRDDHETFETFLIAYCGSKSTGYEWMNAAAVAARYPQEEWLRGNVSIGNELHKLRENPALQEEVLNLVKGARYETVKRLVKEVRQDETLMNQVTADPETLAELQRLSGKAEAMMRSRVQQAEAAGPKRVWHETTGPAITRIRDARDRLRRARGLASEQLPSAEEQKRALELLSDIDTEVATLRQLFSATRTNPG